jgi:glyoxylase-like metal-dependent hydrolase (beta-lactamase superfamily II)
MSDWSLDLGGVRLSGIADEEAFTLPRGFLFPDSTSEMLRAAAALDAHACDVARDEVMLRIQVFLLEIGGRHVLVDAGVGDGKERPNRPSWHRRSTDFLARLGVPPEDISLVLFTHLHPDHVGWATRRAGDRWVPTFPRARHVVAEAEYAHAAAQRTAPLLDSIEPLREAGLLDLVEPGHAPLPGLRFRPLPGHTPAQQGVLIEAARQRVLLSADVLHHALQLAFPEIVSAFCASPGQARATRAALLEEAASEGFGLVTAHAREWPLWRVTRAGAGYALT